MKSTVPIAPRESHDDDDDDDDENALVLFLTIPAPLGEKVVLRLLGLSMLVARELLLLLGVGVLLLILL